MIKTKRLLHLSAFLLLVISTSLFWYRQVMQKTVNHLDNVQQHYPNYKLEGIEQPIQEMYADIIENVADGGYRIKDMKVSERAKKKLVSYRIMSRVIKDMRLDLVNNYQSQEIFTLMDNQAFVHHYEEMEPLYQQVKDYRHMLQQLCDDSLQFKMPSQEEFVNRFNEAPLSITKSELTLLDHAIALEAYQAVEYDAQKLGGCMITFPIDTCAIVNH